MEREVPGEHEQDVAGERAGDRRERADADDAREGEREHEGDDGAEPRRCRDEQQRAEAGRDTTAAASFEERGPAVPGDRSDGRDSGGDRPLLGRRAHDHGCDPYRERALQDVQDRDEQCRAETEGAERVRRAGRAGADCAQVDVAIEPADEVAARHRADAVSDEPAGEDPDDIHQSRAPRNCSRIGVPANGNRSRILFSR